MEAVLLNSIVVDTRMNPHIDILGGGPAGSAAALAALQEGSSVRVFERSRFPRHKVCGEFFSPEIQPDLERLGVWRAFAAAGPARVRRVALHFGNRSRQAALPEPAWGLSRYAFDRLMLEHARTAGAQTTADAAPDPLSVWACGRRPLGARRGKRLFGFKAHFEGPVDDAVELYFFGGCYVGVTAIEDGRSNVCGLAPEDLLARFGFEYDELMRTCPALTARLSPLRRIMEWVSTGPLEYGQRFEPLAAPYPAGDALSFVDPFTGSGLLAAVRSGALAGQAAARGESAEAYLAKCRASLRKPFRVASLLREIVQRGWAERLAAIAPPSVLFALTRPK
jgi:menaquinone-9 beta-reductase